MKAKSLFCVPFKMRHAKFVGKCGAACQNFDITISLHGSNSNIIEIYNIEDGQIELKNAKIHIPLYLGQT